MKTSITYSTNSNSEAMGWYCRIWRTVFWMGSAGLALAPLFDNPFQGQIALGLVFVVAVGLAVSAIRAARPPGWCLAVVAVLSMCLAHRFHAIHVVALPPLAEVIYRFIQSVTWEYWPVLPLWTLGWLYVRDLCRCDRRLMAPGIRRAAVFSLGSGLFLFSYALVIHLVVQRSQLSDLELVNRRLILFGLLTAAAITVVIPWIRIDRRLAGGTVRHDSAWNVAARWLLVVSLLCAFLAMGLLLAFFFMPPHVNPLVWQVAIALAYHVTQLLGASLFAASVAIQLFRDQWHRLLTGVGCCYYVSFWLFFAAEPRVFEVWKLMLP